MAKITDKTPVEKMIERQRALELKLNPYNRELDLSGAAIKESVNRMKLSSYLDNVTNLSNLAASPFDKYSYLTDRIIDIQAISPIAALRSPVLDAIESSVNRLNDHMRMIENLSLTSAIDFSTELFSELTNNSFESFEELVDDLPKTVEPEDAEIIKEISTDVKTVKASQKFSNYEKLSLILQLIPVLIALCSGNPSPADEFAAACHQFICSTATSIELALDEIIENSN